MEEITEEKAYRIFVKLLNDAYQGFRGDPVLMQRIMNEVLRTLKEQREIGP